MKNKNGFTLIELLVTIALIGILGVLATPSFQEAIRDNRLATQTNELVTALQFARAEAVKRGATISVTAKSGSTDWSGGWQVLAGATLLRDFEGSPRLRVTGGDAIVQFTATGVLRNGASTWFNVCAPSHTRGRRLNLGAAGLIRTTHDYNQC